MRNQQIQNNVNGLFAIGVIALFAFACTPQEELVESHIAIFGSGLQGLSVENSELKVPDADGNTVVITRADVNIRELRLTLPEDSEGCDVLAGQLDATVDCNDHELRIVGPFPVDLLSRGTQPSLIDVSLPAGTYKGIDVRIDESDELFDVSSSNEAQTSMSFVVTGDVKVAGTLIPFGIVLGFEEELHVEKPEGLIINDASPDLAVDLNVYSWMMGVPLSACIKSGLLPKDEMGRYWLDNSFSGSGPCAVIEHTLRSNIVHSGRLDEMAVASN
ncbi:MAG: hypothetical protein CMH54_09675 [Myxococcales bacterium]|nr:hypothetical protein [Myxococcales bacterium]|tara:strand:- start:424 stop:1245 length:822 start_codon:yes stop_codon:yes gene_type:complete